MPKIIVEESAAGPEREVDADDGGALVDLADESLLPIPFSCRSATCATCQVEVLEGAELLAPAEDEELSLLDIVGGPAGSRLACQIQLKPGKGLLRIRPF